MIVPECYDPTAQEAERERRWEERLRGRPGCACCDEVVATEEYLDLEPFGLRGVACGRCRDRCSHFTEELDEEG